MCIIISKYRGNKLPKKETLENCFYNNNDGAGIAYTHGGKVYIDKGYNKFEEFYKRLKELDKAYNLKNENVILHFRIGTSGNMDARATHPFPISNKPKELQAPKVDGLSVAVAHNGVISAYAYKNNEGLSDTQNFIKDFLQPLQSINKNFYKYESIRQLIAKTISSKLAIIDNKTITLIGQFEQGTDGNWYSNSSYKNDYFKASKYNSYNWSDYYNYNWNSYSSTKSNLIHKNAKDIMTLKNGIWWHEHGDSIDELDECDEWQAIDKDYNLYDIVDYYTIKNNTYFKLEKIASKVTLYNEHYETIQFKSNANEWELIENDETQPNN